MMRRPHALGPSRRRLQLGLCAGVVALIVETAWGGAVLAPGSHPAATNHATATAAQLLDRLPLSFEPNLGQSASEVKFLSHAPGFTLFLSATEAVFGLRQPQPRTPSHSLPAPPAPASTLRMELVGASSGSQAQGLEPLPGRSNYFLGSDQSRWLTGVPNYSEVDFPGVYPHIDLRYHGQQKQLEFDFSIAPGATPDSIRLRFAGAGRLELNQKGDLVLHTPAGTVVEHRPLAYQQIGGRRRLVLSRFVLQGDNLVGFEAASYDPAATLVIDPSLAYSTYLGGGGGDQGNHIAVDSASDAYVTGFTGSTNFPTNTGAFQTANGGGEDAFVTKLNPLGTGLLYSTYLGGSDSDLGYGIAVDTAGDAYVTGDTASTNFPTTVGAFQTANGGGFNAFVTKLNPLGTGLLYSTYLGGSSGSDDGRGIALDSGGDAYVTGTTLSTNFPTTVGAFQTAFGGGNDAFVTKLNPLGTGLLYSTYLGGSGSDDGRGIALDSAGDAYVTGTTLSTNFPTTTGVFQTASGGGNDAFVAKLNPLGTGLLYSTYLGGSGTDVGYGIALDSAGDAHVTGYTASTNFPTTTGVFQTASGGGNDAFVAKLNPLGTGLLYSTYLGGSGADYGYGIALDTAGDAYVTGITASTNFPTTTGAFQTANGGGEDAFVTKLNPLGTGLLYSTNLGGSGTDDGLGIAVDSAGDAYVTGFTASTNFPTTPGALQTAFGGGDGFGDAFVAKLSGLPSSPASCPENDGNGDVKDENSDKHASHDRDVKVNSDQDDNCEEQKQEPEEADEKQDRDQEHVDTHDNRDGSDFHSTKVDSVQFSQAGKQVTILGSGVHSDRAVSFVAVEVDNGPSAPGFFSLQLSDGYKVAGHLIDGAITLH